MSEAFDALSGMAKAKSPGCDGLPAEFYLTFWEILGADLVEVFNASFVSGLLPSSQRMLIIIFKCLHLQEYPQYLKDLFTLRSVTYCLRGSDILHLRKPSSTTYGLKSFSYFAAKTWNSLPEIIKTATSLNDFITAIRQCTFS